MENPYSKEIQDRLKSFGYEYAEDEDKSGIDFCIAKVEAEIKNFCNIRKIPKELKWVLIDMVVGEYFFMRKNAGLSLGSIEIKPVISSINEGDVSVSYVNDGSNEKRFDKLINDLINGHESSLIRYRKMVW